MRRVPCLSLFCFCACLLLVATVGATPAYRSFIEWNGPYYHVRHALGADTAYTSYLVNNPLPLYSLPFSSPTAVALCGTAASPVAFVVDHDHNRVQAFSTHADWNVETLSFSGAPAAGNYGGRTIHFSHGQVLAASELILVNRGALTRVSSLSGYAPLDSVYTIAYDSGIVALPGGWDLHPADSVRVEYVYADPVGNSGTGDVDYVLFQSSPTDIPLQLNETTCTTDPAMNDITSLAVAPSAGVGRALDLYLVNALPGGEGTLASYDLTNIGAGGVFHHVDTYRGQLGRPYSVKIVTNGPNAPGTVTAGPATGVSTSRLTLAVRNQNTYLGHDYRIAYTFDTTGAMNQSTASDNRESDLAFDPVAGRLHMVFCNDDAAEGTAYSYSDDYGQTWSHAITISPESIVGFHDRPRIALRGTGEIHVVYEATNMLGERHLYHTHSADGIAWSVTQQVTTDITPATVTENRYANLLVNPVTDAVHLIWAGDDDVYHNVFTESWSGSTQIATGSGSGFSAPHAVINAAGRIYMAFVSNAVPPCQISYMLYDGTQWGSFDNGTFTAASTDTVTQTSGVAGNGGGRGEVFPFPQIALTGDSVWIFWAGQGTEVYGTDPCQLYFSRINALYGEFSASSGTAITTGDFCAPLRFTVASDEQHNLRIVYPFGTVVDQEGLRCKTWLAESNKWLPDENNAGRTIFTAGTEAATFAYEPRLIAPSAMGQAVPMLACAKAYSAVCGGSPRILFKILDGLITVTDHTTLSEINRFRVWTSGQTDTTAIPGLSITVQNSSISISNTDDVNASEFNVSDAFEVHGTAPLKNNLLFLTDADSNCVKVMRTYDNGDHCFAGDVRWDVPGKSDGSPSQTYKLAATGGAGSYRVWAGLDSAAWTVVHDLLIAGPDDRVCELNRYTHEVRFGDNGHGAIPPRGAYIRVRYEESVDDAEFGAVGSGSGQLTHPHGLAARYNPGLGQYDVYVCDSGNNRLEKWAYRPNAAVDPASWSTPIVSWRAASADSGLLHAPEDVDVATVNDQVFLVVTDNGNHRLVVYRDDAASGNGGSSPPAFVSTIGGTGTSLNGFADPRGLAAMADDSSLIIYATDAERNEVSKIVQRDWLSAGAPDTSGGAGAQTLSLSLNDALDGDSYLLLQPGATRTLELRATHCDSLMSLHLYATFPAAAMQIMSISEGNLWSGEHYTNKVFLYDFNDTTGRIEINAAMVGDHDGLTTSGSRTVATLVVRAKSAMVVPFSGAITLADSSDLRNADNHRITAFTHANLTVLGGYLADIASPTGNPGTPPHMVPHPDGRIDFADVNVFTQGWNGDGVSSDPIADIGPFIGDTLPGLVANPDGRMDAYDLLALSTMYNWDNPSAPIVAPPPSPTRSTLDESAPVVAVASQTNGRWTVELQARDVQALTTAHIYLEITTPGASVTAVRPGDFLGTENTLCLHREHGAASDISLGRLNRLNPCASGSGLLAIAEVSLPSGAVPQIRVVYELRDQHNTIVASGETQQVQTPSLPLSFGLDAPYPNPFNSRTTFTLNLTEPGRTTLRVFNVLGQQAAVIVNQNLPAGTHRLNWDARSTDGFPLPSGIYLARLETPGHTAVRKVVLLR